MDLLIQRIQAIAERTGTGDQKAQVVNDGEKVDEFTLRKRTINQAIRELRNDIEEKEAHNNSADGKANPAEIVRQSTAIRGKIKQLRTEAGQLREMVEKDFERLERKGKPLDAAQNRLKVVELIDAHIEECDRWSRGLPYVSQKDNPKRRALLKGANFRDDGPIEMAEFVPSKASETQLEDIDGFDEWLLQIQEGEQKFNELQDVLVEKSAALIHLARRLGEENRVVTHMVNEVNDKADTTQVNVDNAIVQEKKLQKRLATKSNCCLDIFLFLIIVVLAGYLIWKYT